VGGRKVLHREFSLALLVEANDGLVSFAPLYFHIVMKNFSSFELGVGDLGVWLIRRIVDF